MKEQSHKDEMSAALRGDFQRLRARGVSAALVPQEREEPQQPLDEPTGEEQREEPRAEEQPPEAQDPPAEAPPERRGWLSRLGGR
jgi:hypothetical protein